MALPSAVWDRLPLPAEHCVGLLAGLCLQRMLPRARLPTALARGGWVLLVVGVGLEAWAVAARQGEPIDRPGHLVTDGPQAWTRNPMYAGWSLLHVGFGLLVRSPWVLATWPPSFALLHLRVLREEHVLADRFGQDFSEYRARVPRYVSLARRGTSGTR